MDFSKFKPSALDDAMAFNYANTQGVQDLLEKRLPVLIASAFMRGVAYGRRLYTNEEKAQLEETFAEVIKFMKEQKAAHKGN